MSSITLSTGTVVTFKAKYTHGADRAWNKAFSEGVFFEQDENGNDRPIEKIPVSNLVSAYEAALPHLIEKAGDQTVTKEWLGDLSVEDYRLLDIEARKMRAESTGGKKKD